MTDIAKKDKWCEIKKEIQKAIQRKKIKNGKKKEGEWFDVKCKNKIKMNY